MTQGERIKLEVRLHALEFMVCKAWTAMIQAGNPTDEKVEAIFREVLAGAEKQKFPNLDPAMSDLASAEWVEAIERLLGLQRKMLAQLRAQPGDRPGSASS